MRELCAYVVELRRGDHSAQRLRLEREQLAATQKRTERERVEEFWKWAANPDIREQICRGFLTRVEKIEMLGKLMFGDDFRVEPNGNGESDTDPSHAAIDEPHPSPAPPIQGESSPIKVEDKPDGV